MMSSKINLRNSVLIAVTSIFIIASHATSRELTQTHETLTKKVGVGSWGFDTTVCITLGIKACGRAVIDLGGDFFIVQEEGSVKLETTTSKFWFDGTTGSLNQNFGIEFGAQTWIVILGRRYDISIPYIPYFNFLLKGNTSFTPYSINQTQILQASIPRQELICVGVDVGPITGKVCLEADAGNRFQFTGNEIKTSRGNITANGQKKSVTLSCSSPTFSITSIRKEWDLSYTATVSCYFTIKVKVGFISYELPITLIKDFPLPLDRWIDGTFETTPSRSVSFDLPCYNLALDKQGNGQVRVDGSTRSLPWTEKFLDGKIVSLLALPSSCYDFDNWSGSITGTNPSTSVTMTSIKSITAHFGSQGNDPPNITGLPSSVCGGDTYLLKANANDADDFSWNSSCGGTFSNPFGSQTNWKAPSGHMGSCKITVDVSSLGCDVDSDDATTTVFQDLIAPALSIPSNGSLDIPRPVTLNWFDVDGADSYELQIDDNNDFISPVISVTVTSSNYIASGLLSEVKYFWRVRASNFCGTGPWSEIWDFTTSSDTPIDSNYVKIIIINNEHHAGIRDGNFVARILVTNDTGWIGATLGFTWGTKPEDSINWKLDSVVLGSGILAWTLPQVNIDLKFARVLIGGVDFSGDPAKSFGPGTNMVFADLFFSLRSGNSWGIGSYMTIDTTYFPPAGPWLVSTRDRNLEPEFFGAQKVSYNDVNIDVDAVLPVSFELSQNYPNPFNPTTQIRYRLPKTEHVLLEIYNVMGQRVATLVNQTMEPGEHVVTWNGSSVASGVYFYRFHTEIFRKTRKMVLMK